MNKKGSGKWQLKIIEYLHGTESRFTAAALGKTLRIKKCIVSNSLNGLLEMGAIKADAWRTGYCYRSPHTSTTADVIEVKLVAQITATKA